MRSKLVWTNAAWFDYLWWQVKDKKTLKRVHLPIKDAMSDPEDGIEKTEALKENLSDLWLTRIDDTNRLVYAIGKEQLVIIACRYHYE